MASERKLSEGGAPSRSQFPTLIFPTHNSPRVWFLTSAMSPLAIRLIRHLLAHRDYVVCGLQDTEDDERSLEYRELINECKAGGKDREGWKDRIRGIRCDGRIKGECSAAIAEAVEVFGRVDILLCCTSEAVVGTVEELSTNSATQSLVQAQFETVYFSQVNFIKAVLPIFRAKHNGHVIVLTNVSGHIGTPGMGLYSASLWALEGFCDSLAYEVAPFNIRVTIVQPNKEVSVLTNKIIFAPQLPQYESNNNPAPGLRGILTNVVNAHPDTHLPEHESDQILSRYPHLSPDAKDRLVMETVHALTAIGGHENPPARHIVGYEGVASVKEKLKTVSEELEDFIEVSFAVDILPTEVGKGGSHESKGEHIGGLATSTTSKA